MSSLVITVALIHCVLLLSPVNVESQGCLKCTPRTPNTDRCCRRFAMCCPAEKPSEIQDGIETAAVADNNRRPFDKNGKCPEDRFPNATVTICLRKSCTEDGHCFGPQKCCNYGHTKCCVYPLSPLFT